MPVIPVNKVVDPKGIIGKMEGQGGEEAQGVAVPPTKKYLSECVNNPLSSAQFSAHVDLLWADLSASQPSLTTTSSETRAEWRKRLTKFFSSSFRLHNLRLGQNFCPQRKVNHFRFCFKGPVTNISQKKKKKKKKKKF
jgi:hypothetical protein